MIDVLVVGAGVAGLASALHLATRGIGVCVLDHRPRPGMEASTHNSGVIHAGLYYPPGSLKARLCLRGRDALYEFCERHHVPHRRSGKLVVADDPNRETELEAIARNARENGARAELWGRREIQAVGPSVEASLALWSPDTGLVDASRLVRALSDAVTAADGIVLTGTTIEKLEHNRGGWAVRTGRETIDARVIVNAAGLFADDVSRAAGGETFRIWACRGDYAQLTAKAASRFTVPIYPMPEKSGHGLGVHITPSTDGSVMLGGIL